MNKSRTSVLESLFGKSLQGTITAAEKKILYDLISDPENESVVKEFLLNNINEFVEEPSYYNKSVDFETIYGNILYEIKQNEIKEEEKSDYLRRTRLRKAITYTISIAAVSLVAFFMGRFVPYHAGNPATVNVLTYNEITAPYGSKSEIRLPDGTDVMLNAGSVLKYSSDFNLSNRNLSLKGEAYFKVAKNEKIPLIVNAGSINIRAVGTEFNVKAYDEEGTIETTLVKGKVEITSDSSAIDEQGKFVDLVPNQKAIYIKDDESFVLEEMKEKTAEIVRPVKTVYENILISPKVNVDQVVAWTKGRLILRGENLENLCIELERMYDVKIKFIDEDAKKYRFTGVLLDETLEQVLNAIKLTAPISYSLDGKTVYLHSDAVKLEDYSKHMK
jgi:ferric-dicitrate binding protein FerR (iron transport regulator)